MILEEFREICYIIIIRSKGKISNLGLQVLFYKYSVK